MAAKPGRQTNPMHNRETSFEGGLTIISDDPGLPLDSPEVIERDRKRREHIADKKREEQDAGDGS